VAEEVAGRPLEEGRDERLRDGDGPVSGRRQIGQFWTSRLWRQNVGTVDECRVGLVRNGGPRAFGPGRVNLVGEHTDYNDGLCLPFAIELGVTVEAHDGPPGRIVAQALDLGERDEFDLERPAPAEGWRTFVRGIVAELGPPLRPARLAISGTLPRGAGLASAAALEVALALVLLAHSGRGEPDRRELARLCSRAEHAWFGAHTGLLDQIASLFGERGRAIRIDMRDLAITPVPLRLGGWRLVVVGSGATHSHAESGYNERRQECGWARETLGVRSLRDADPGSAALLPDPLDRRVRHVLEENARVEQAVAALVRDDLPALGRLLDASHASLRDLYEVSVPEVERTVERVRDAGAAGARIMGGGFGGSVLALFPPGARPPADAVEVAPGPAAGLR
jgi:galactokinase